MISFFLLEKAFLENIQQCHSNAGSTETFTIKKKKKKDGNDPVIALHLGVRRKKIDQELDSSEHKR